VIWPGYLKFHYDSKESEMIHSEISGCIQSKRFRRGEIMYCNDASRLLVFVFEIFVRYGRLFVPKSYSALTVLSLK